MSITLNHSDFQCLQDQLVELKTKNYELAEKHRRGQADFEAAKAKICSLQLKLEEQERDFQVTSTTLRQEIAAVHSNNSNDADPNNKNDQDYHAKYKKLLAKAKELQQRYEKSVEVIQSMDDQIKTLTGKANKLLDENSKLKETLEDKQKRLEVIEEEHKSKLERTLEELKEKSTSDCQEYKDNLVAITEERDNLKSEVERLLADVKQFDIKLANQAEERKLQERKGLQMVKDLKRQLTAEKNNCETLQKRLESLMSEMIPSSSTNIDPTSSDIDIRGELSASSSTNGNSHHGSSSNGTSGRANNQDANSVSSWSLVPNNTKAITKSNQGLCESLSICSIDSEDRGTVQQLPASDTKSDSSLLPISSSSQSTSRFDLSNNSPNVRSNNNTQVSSYDNDNNEPTFVRRNSSSMVQYSDQSGHHNSQVVTTSGMSIDEQAALMERLTRLQHDKWTLEEKLSYMEQANMSLTQDLANKSDIIKNYFMEQAMRSANNHSHMDSAGVGYLSSVNNHSQHRRASLSTNVNQLLSEKPSLKKVVDFLKERSQVTSSESESLTREAAKKMQLMLEETLIKCLKLQENLDLVTSELNKLER